jgi:filamentous hemagglutinin family protein
MHNWKSNRLPQLRALALAVQTVWALPALALPEGATVVNGQVVMSQPSANNLQIQASNGAIINWQKFSIGVGQTTQFVQPSAASAVLNRVVGPDISQLFGQLKANGQVFLINPSGIIIGSAARIDTNSFVASTLNISDADFLAGKLKFAEGASAGRISNAGSITAGPGGSIALIAPDIENTGIIRAPDGNILLAAGRKLEITSMDLDGVSFEIQAPTDVALNLGKLLAENGAVRAFAGSLRNSGEVRATSLALDAGGNIVLAGSSDVSLTSGSVLEASGASGGTVVVQSSGGTASIGGTISAMGSNGVGGSISLLGNRVGLENGALVDASGTNGGGSVLVGGDFQGGNASVQNAQRTFVAPDAVIKADATVRGNGGRIVIWADENTQFQGSLSARGGDAGGKGGFAEVSGKVNLEFTGTADLTAKAGTPGDLLLDPLDIFISSSGGLLPSVVDQFADFPSNVVTISPAALAAVGANVTLQANRDIIIKDAIALSTGGAGLTATAGGINSSAGGMINNIGGITTAGGAVTLSATSINGSGGISSNGGAVSLTTTGLFTYSGAVTTSGGDINLSSVNSSVVNANANAGSGTINVSGGAGVYSGSYRSTGTINLNSSAGSISVYNITGGIINLSASSSIDVNVVATDRTNASSTNSYISLYNNGTDALRLGTISAPGSISLESETGMVQASGGVLTSPYIYLYTDNSSASTGAITAPLQFAGTGVHISAYNMAAPVYLNLNGSATLAALSLQGNLSGVGGSVFTGSANLSTLSLNGSGGVLNVSAIGTTGMSGGLSLDVNNAAINAPLITLPGAPVSLSSNTAVSVGTLNSGSLSIEAKGAVNIDSATTTSSSGISVLTNGCAYYSYSACTLSGPITAGTLNASGGQITLTTQDNGSINVSSISGNSASIYAGRVYYTSQYPYYFTEPTTNGITLNTVNLVNDLYNYSISPYYTPRTTTNNINITNSDPANNVGAYSVYNNGIGNITINGDVNRASGSINLRASHGDLTTQNLTALNYVDLEVNEGAVTAGNITSQTESVSVYAGGGGLTVLNVSAGSPSTYFPTVSLTADGDVSFTSITSTSNGIYSGYGSVDVTSYSGSIKTTVDSPAYDIIASGTVSLSTSDSTNGAIGNPGFTNPLDIMSGPFNSVSLQAGTNIGAAGKPVIINTTGDISATSYNGQFHIAATDGVNGINIANVLLAAHAGGMGLGGTSTFTSANLNISAISNGNVIDLGDISQTRGTLNSFSFEALSSSSLSVGDINLAAATGSNNLSLRAGNGIMQLGSAVAGVNPQTHLVLNPNITAGSITLNGGEGNISIGNVTSALISGNRVNITGYNIDTGNIDANSIRLEGNNITTGSLESHGTQRYNYSTPDNLTVVAGGDLNINGSVTSATVVDLNAYNLNVTGEVRTNGSHRYTYYGYYIPDAVRLNAGNNITVGGGVTAPTSVTVHGGGNVSIGGTGISAGTASYGYYYATDTMDVRAGSNAMLDAPSITGGYNSTISAGTINVSTISGAANDTTLTGTNFNNYTLQTPGTLTINASADYQPNGVEGAMTIDANRVVVRANNDININANDAYLTAPNVELYSTNGNVAADLRGTSNLTLETGHGFYVTSDTWLSAARVRADWYLATDSGDTAGSVGASVISNSDNGMQEFSYATNPNGLGMTVQSSNFSAPNWNLTHNETSSHNTPVDLSINHSGAGSFSFTSGMIDPMSITGYAQSGQLYVDHGGPVNLNSVTMGGRIEVYSGGDLNANGVTTNGAYINLDARGGAANITGISTNGGSLSVSANGDINLGSIATSGVNGGTVDMSSSYGSILMANNTPIDSGTLGQVAPTPGGSVNLRANNGSVGTVNAPIRIVNASGLEVAVRDELNVEANNSTLNYLSVVADAGGIGAITLTGSNNFSGLSIVRSFEPNELILGTLQPTNTPSFTLEAINGGIRLDGNLSGLANLTLSAGNGNLDITASGGPRTIDVMNSINLMASQDILIQAGSGAADSVAIHGGTVSMTASRDIIVAADGASASVSSSGSNYSQTYSAERNLRVLGGAGADAFAAINASGGLSYQTIHAGSNFDILGGSGTGAYAQIENTHTYQQVTTANAINIQAGSGDNAKAKLAQEYSGSGYQNITSNNSISVQGGNSAGLQGSGASALIVGNNQSINLAGTLTVAGGTAADNMAAITGASQSIGNTSSGNHITSAISVTGGSGDRSSATISASSSQTLYAAAGPNESSGNITISGGSGVDASANVTAGSGQTIGSSSDYCYYYGCAYPTQSVTVSGGSGNGAVAQLTAGSTQNISAGGVVSVLGGTGTAANASIVTTGSQSIGSSSYNQNDSTDGILVRAGSGGTARITATGSQSIQSAGDIAVSGGSGTNMSATIESLSSSQNIGNTQNYYYYYNDPTDSIMVQAGTGAGASASIKAATGQSIDAGGTITVTAGALAGASAEINTSAGSQSIGNANVYNNFYTNDPTNSITLSAGGAAGSYARISTGGSQTIRTAGDLTLTGGNGDNADARVQSVSGQDINIQGLLSILGGSGTSAAGNQSGVRNTAAGTQSVIAISGISVLGGATGSATFIDNNSLGLQTLSSSNGSLTLANGTGLSGSTATLSINSSGAQNLDFNNGDITIRNDGALSAIVAAAGDQNIVARTLSLLVSNNTVTNARAVINSGGDQSVSLNGDSLTAGTATLTLSNGAASGDVGFNATGSFTLSENYNAAGVAQVGSTTDMGASYIHAGTDVNIVAGALKLQGGAVDTAQVSLTAGLGNNMIISTLYGPVEVKGGTNGGSNIDPLNLAIVANGSVSVISGPGAAAGASVNVFNNFDVAATNGDLNVISGGAPVTIDTVNFAFTGSNNVNLNPGMISVSGIGSINIPGVCNNCDTGLSGSFSITAYVPPPMNFGPLVIGTIVSLTDYATGNTLAYEVTEDGTLVLTSRRLNQCY